MAENISLFMTQAKVFCCNVVTTTTTIICFFLLPLFVLNEKIYFKLLTKLTQQYLQRIFLLYSSKLLFFAFVSLPLCLLPPVIFLRMNKLMSSRQSKFLSV